MNKLLSMLLMTVGGWVGWWAGAFMGTETAFFLSMVGTGLGLYVGRRFADYYLG